MTFKGAYHKATLKKKYNIYKLNQKLATAQFKKFNTFGTAAHGMAEGKNRKPIKLGVGVPQDCLVKLKYSDSFQSIGVNAGSISQDRTYRLDGPYDPRTDTGAGQISAQYFQTYANIYNYHKVYAAEVRQKIFNQSNAPIHVVSIADNTLGNNYTAGDARVLQENKLARTKVCVPIGSGKNYVEFKRKFYIHELMGMSREQYNGSDMTAAATTTVPANGTYITLALINQTMGSIAVLIQTDITYYCRFWDPKVVLSATTADVPEYDAPVGDAADEVIVPLTTVGTTPIPIT